jgi:organic radical activating enzyme
MHEIPNKVDFYITNVCNLTCNNCNRFNNYNFKGWQSWHDYQKTYQQWGELIRLNAITIMGGEPFLNPTLKDWVSGLNKIFNIEVQILTNGTRFSHVADLYTALVTPVGKNQARNHIGVSLHNTNDWASMKDDILNFLQHPVKQYEKNHANNTWGSDWLFIDKNQVQINVYTVNQFVQSSVLQLGPGRFSLYQSDPVAAHKDCSFAKWKSYHFIKGKLYKCGPVALMPEFDLQHKFEITEQQREILHSYRPLDVDNFTKYHKEFFDNLNNPISQCQFCPENLELKTIYPLRKGIKL